MIVILFAALIARSSSLILPETKEAIRIMAEFETATGITMEELATMLLQGEAELAETEEEPEAPGVASLDRRIRTMESALFDLRDRGVTDESGESLKNFQEYVKMLKEKKKATVNSPNHRRRTDTRRFSRSHRRRHVGRSRRR